MQWRLFLVIAIVAVACTTGSEEQPDQRSAPRTAPTAEPTTRAPPTTAAETPPRVWVAAEDAGSVAEVALGPTPTVVRTVSLSGPVHNLVVAPDGTVAATLPAVGRLALVSGDAVTEIDLGGSPHDVKPAGGRLVVANEGTARIQLVGVGGPTEAEVSLKGQPHDVAISPDGFAWVSLDASSDLAVVDLAAQAVVRYVTTGLRPHDLLFAPDGRLWVTDWDGLLGILAPDGGEIGRVRVGEETHHLAFAGDGSQVWVTDEPGQQAIVVDATTLGVLASLPIGGPPHHVAVAGRWAVVADHGRGVAIVFDATTRQRVADVPVGAGPHGVAAAADG
jgi:DNA-binding beta-propeller fold protein YncE